MMKLSPGRTFRRPWIRFGAPCPQPIYRVQSLVRWRFWRAGIILSLDIGIVNAISRSPCSGFRMGDSRCTTIVGNNNQHFIGRVSALAVLLISLFRVRLERPGSEAYLVVPYGSPKLRDHDTAVYSESDRWGVPGGTSDQGDSGKLMTPAAGNRRGSAQYKVKIPTPTLPHKVQTAQPSS
ncbi:hypothetical protein BV22DRAFT_571170 [Leucogyrophana mollusca]|uniref:Uncharacterized protein n=1 Tax=Leucogyrophana mollusca TaxID=85980 RepID=A0ACB8BCP1_9AGAM|nr:hypothetical protein BV22DRAFT_571170 [Leucogyrophana mollusca]